MPKKTDPNTPPPPLEDDSNWRVEQDLRTLVEAMKINKDPKRLEAAKKLAAQRQKELQSIGAEVDEEMGEDPTTEGME